MTDNLITIQEQAILKDLGIQGPPGRGAYVHFKWATEQPTADEDMTETPDVWIGISSNNSVIAPTAYTDYQWYQYKGTTGSTGAGLEFTWSGTQLGVRREGEFTYTYIDLKGDTGEMGDTGVAGRGITSIVRTSGNGSAGTTDTYTITYSDSTTSVFYVYNGADGEGDMLKTIYDTDDDGKVDAAEDADKLGGVAASGYAKEISGQTSKTTLANNDAFAIADSEDSNTQKKTLWSTIKSVLKTYFDTLYSEIGALADDGDGQNVTVTFSEAGTQTNIATGETLATLFGKLKKWFTNSAWTTDTDTSSTTDTISTAVNHTHYIYTQALTSFTITNFPASGDWDFTVEFVAGTGITGSWPTTKWNGDTAPTLTAGKRYCLLFSNRISSYGQTTT